MYGIVVDVPAPVVIYDALHAQVVAQVGAAVDGLLVHVGRKTDTGFQVFEIWESKEHYHRFNATVVFPLMGAYGAEAPPDAGMAAQEFEIRGLIVPRAGVAQ